MIDPEIEIERTDTGEGQVAGVGAVQLEDAIDLPLSLRVASETTDRCATGNAWLDRYRRSSRSGAGRF